MGLKNLKRSEKSFTLAEMLVVIGILGILLIIGIPALRNYQRRYLLKDAADKTVLILRQAQSLALSPERSVLGYLVEWDFSSSSSSRTLAVYKIIKNSTGGLQKEPLSALQYNIPLGVSISPSRFSVFFSTPLDLPEVPYKRKVLFNASISSGVVNGTCSSGDTQITLSQSSLSYTININCETGKIEFTQ